MMTKRVLAWAALAVVSMAQIAAAHPDLAVTNLEIVPVAPTHGTSVTLTATIENLGPSDAESPFFVRFCVDDQEIDLVPVISLRSGRSEQLAATWTATAGPHILSVQIDGPLDRVEEVDELNNTRSVHLDVRLDDELMALLAPLKIAVARFEDASGTGFVNVGAGVADELAERFRASGLRVLDRVELETVMQSSGLNPASPDDVASAGRLLGADLLVTGSVVGVDVQEGSLSVAFLRVESAAADVSLSAHVVDVLSSQRLSFVSADGRHEGTTGFSIDLGQLLSFLGAGSSQVCSGGLQTARSWYNAGQTVLIGYRNEAAASWFGVEIYSSTGAFLRWLGWQFVEAGECETWSWDQLGASGVAMNPGIYTAKLWDGTSYIDTVGFQIRPGISLSSPTADEITVGSEAFNETVVGVAMNRAVDGLTSALLFSLEAAAPYALDRAAPASAAAEAAPPASPREGQIAAILPDGRIAINLGASSGVTEGDVFEVLEVANLVVDPQTSEILFYDLVAVKGQIVISEARDQVSYAAPTNGLIPVIGDVVRGVP